ncbi:4523_t:CDS:2, partial [Scutellospora calospora]
YCSFAIWTSSRAISLFTPYFLWYPLQVQNRKRMNDAIKQGLVVIECVKGLANYIGWETVKANKYRERKRFSSLAMDLFCSGESSCQKLCSRIGSYIETCNYYTISNIKNPLNMHKYSIWITIEVILSEVDTDLPMHMIISGNHISQNIIQERAISSWINLSQEARDLAILNYQANKYTTKEIKMKLLASHNRASQNELQKLYDN